jgi:hypothetical protein
MSGEAPGRHGNGVETHFSRVKVRPLGEEMLGCSCNACLLAGQYRFYRIGESITCLHFDETDHAARRTGNEVDLTQTRANTAAEDTISFGEQKQSCKKLATSATLFGSPSRDPRRGFFLHSVIALRARARS